MTTKECESPDDDIRDPERYPGQRQQQPPPDAGNTKAASARPQPTVMDEDEMRRREAGLDGFPRRRNARRGTSSSG